MKKMTGLILVVMMLFMQAGVVFAVTKNFSMILPPATGASITVFKVVKSGTAPNFTYVFTPWTHGTDLGFSTDAAMIYHTENDINIWLPQYYFALDVAPTGGTGNPTVSVSYAQGNNPNGASGHGLDYKGSISFSKVTGQTGSQSESVLFYPVRFGMVASAVGNIVPTNLGITDGFLRIYIGIGDGSMTGGNSPEVFTNSDMPGTYTGVLTITLTTP